MCPIVVMPDSGPCGVPWCCRLAVSQAMVRDPIEAVVFWIKAQWPHITAEVAQVGGGVGMQG